MIKESFETDALVDEQALQRTMDSEQMMRIRTQQLDEKRRFLEYQAKLIFELMTERAEEKKKKKEVYQKRIIEQDEKVSFIHRSY